MNKKYLLLSFVLCMFAVLFFIWYYFFSSFSRTETTAYVYIDSDDTVDSVLAKLAPVGNRHGMIGFSTLARHAGYENSIHTGRYAVEPDESAFSLLRRLKSGRQEAIHLVIPESRTLQMLAGNLSRKLMADSIALEEIFTDSTLLGEMGYDTATIAALFVPNTYDVYWDITPQHLMERMQREHKAFWTEKRLGAADTVGLTPVEVCTLASIIDEETANNKEKPMIAGMYLNRLKLNMPLQADPTIKFAMRRFELRRVYRDMLNYDSPWNTYRNIGLPPGPIKIASQAGIDAVLNRVVHDYLYMCAKEDFSGTHNFARTYQEHLQNAARYSRALNERGIK
jgi:UPF0755 protein